MTSEVVRAQLEDERTWRANEFRMLRNQLAVLAGEEQRAIYRKTLVVMLYSHFEGFCRNAFAIYVHAVNEKALRVGDVSWSLATSALSDVFDQLHNQTAKSNLFKRALPSDTKLHRYARDRDFLESLDGFQERTVALNVDYLSDPGSNLKPAVLKKLLFRLGFDHTLADEWADQLHYLLGRRNNIAHGASRQGVDAKTFEDYEESANAVMDVLSEAIFRELADKRYARTS